MSLALALNSHEQVAAGYADGPARIYRDEAIFRRDEVKTHLYFIEAGTVGVDETARGSNTVFAFAGDTVGFGSFDRYSYTAQAVGEARVSAGRRLKLPPSAPCRNNREDCHEQARAKLCRLRRRSASHDHACGRGGRR
jgi:hypothetical protein